MRRGDKGEGLPSTRSPKKRGNKEKRGMLGTQGKKYKRVIAFCDGLLDVVLFALCLIIIAHSPPYPLRYLIVPLDLPGD